MTVTSDDNVITLTGECSKVTVKGKINVTGDDVNVVWGNGIGGKPPKISQKKGNDINIGRNGK